MARSQIQRALSKETLEKDREMQHAATSSFRASNKMSSLRTRTSGGLSWD